MSANGKQPEAARRIMADERKTVAVRKAEEEKQRRKREAEAKQGTGSDGHGDSSGSEKHL